MVEFIIAERIDLFDEIKIPAELQHRMLADRVMRGEESSEFEARHGLLSGLYCFWVARAKLRGGAAQGNHRSRILAYADWCHARSRWIAADVRL
jgi:hypothetical protein